MSNEWEAAAGVAVLLSMAIYLVAVFVKLVVAPMLELESKKEADDGD